MNDPNVSTGDSPKPRRRLSLSAKILLGLILGVGCGLFFGEYCASLKILGDAFVGLLQMTVLPYITCSLVFNIGRLTPQKAKRVFGIGGLVLLALWVIAVLAIVTAPSVLPQAEIGSFFSADLVETPESFDLVALYIPINPFHSLANAVVPAVVVFSIFLGVALMGVERKQGLMEVLDISCRALIRVNSFVVRLTPIGMFAIAAAAAGTLRWEEIARLEAYLLVYVVVAGALVFWVLPMMVVSTTPITYRELMAESRDAVVTAFATGKTFVVLPQLIEGAGRLLRRMGHDGEEADSEAGLLIPLAYPFPTVGKLLVLLFIPFGAWFVGTSLDLGQLFMLVGTGLLALFGSPVAAIPFLLDLFQLPADLFNLFLLSGVFGARLSDSVGAMHLMVFTVLVGAILGGVFKVHRRRLLIGTVAGMAVLVVVAGAARAYLDVRFGDVDAVDVPASMSLRIPPVPNAVLLETEPNPDPLLPGESRLDRIRRRGLLRVGYHPDELPFSYINESGELVGFDIEIAHRFAFEMGVEIEFVPVNYDLLAEQLEGDCYDIAMAGVVGSYQHLHSMLYADSSVDLTAAVLVPDHRRKHFMSRAAINDLGSIKLGIVGKPRLSRRLTEQLAGVSLVPIESHRDYFDGSRPELAGLVVVAEIGAAWTMRYPNYSVVIPEDMQVGSSLVYPMASDAADLLAYVERWSELAGEDGTTEFFYDYWILGRGLTTDTKRWSVIRDVLHWVE